MRHGTPADISGGAGAAFAQDVRPPDPAGESDADMTARDWGLLLLLSLLWGGTYFFVRVALDDLPPLTLVLLRVAIASAALLIVLKISGQAMPFRRDILGVMLVMAILNNMIPFILFFWAQTVLPAGLAAILNATTPLFTVVVMHLFTADEKATPNKVAGVVLGFLGVVVLIGPAAAGALDTPLWALLACLGAALSYAVSGLWGRRIKPLGLAPTFTAWAQLTCTTALMAPLAAVVEKPWALAMPGPAAIAATLALALASTAFAYILFFKILASAGPTNLLLVTFLIPASAIFLGSVFLGERLAPTHFAGLALIGLGLAAIDGRLWKRLTGAPAAS